MARKLKDEEILELLLDDFPSDIDTPDEESSDSDTEQVLEKFELNDVQVQRTKNYGTPSTSRQENISSRSQAAEEIHFEDSSDFDNDQTDDEQESNNVPAQQEGNNKKQAASDNTDFLSIENESNAETVNRSLKVSRKFRRQNCVTNFPKFTRQKGVIEQYFSQKDSATDIFLTVLSSEVIENIIFQTNLYIVQKGKRIQPITKEELYAFLGIEFFCSYHRLPQKRHYWCCDSDLGVPIVTQTMTRERYKQILSVIHLNDNLSIPDNNRDKLYKIRPLITTLNENFQKLRLPDQFQSIDESMVRFKGRSSLKQYNPMKPVKRGYKLWCRADMSGYMYEFDVYQGKTSDSGKEKFGLGGSVVQKLTSCLHHNNYIVVMDNYFSSVDLFEYLKAHGVFACGTVRPNRLGLPKLKSDKELLRGEFDSQTSEEGITFFKWKDNKSVYFLSNFHGTETVEIKRKQKDGTRIDVTAPVVVRDYNSHMGGVDKADMLRSIYDRDCKAKKWWHRLFFAAIDITLVNSYVIYSDFNGRISFLQFKRMVTQGLLTKGKAVLKKRGRPKQETSPSSLVNKRRKKGFSLSNDIRTQNLGVHWPNFVANRGRCENCAMHNIESRPHSQCSHCKVFLCVNERKNCFYEYHFS